VRFPNRTGLECLINSKIHYNCTHRFVVAQFIARYFLSNSEWKIGDFLVLALIRPS
jgi:hypothetical protein